MKNKIIFLNLIILCLLFSGCLYSINPWLVENLESPDISLLGEWVDSEQNEETVTFLEGKEAQYRIIMKGKNEIMEYTGSLHKVAKTLFLQVSSKERYNFYKSEFLAMLPVFLLFKVELEENRLKIFCLDTMLLDDILEKYKIKTLPLRNRLYNQAIITSSTEELEEFIQKITKENITIFKEKDPLMFLKKPY